MTWITIPALAQMWWDGWGGLANYVDTIDWSYNVYSARLIQLNIPDAWNDWTNTSQARRWLANIPARHGQNSVRDSAYAVSTVSWDGSLDLYSITNSFLSPIDEIGAMRLKFGVYIDGIAQVTLNEDESKIWDVGVWVSDYIWQEQNQKTFIINSWGNYFIPVVIGTNIQTFACDSDGITTSDTAADTEAIGWTSNRVWNVVAGKDDYFWVLRGVTNPAWNNISLFWWLFQIDSAWQITQVWSRTSIHDVSMSMFGAQNRRFIASYIENNTCYFVYMLWLQDRSLRWRGTIDLSNTWAFMHTLESSTSSSWQWFGFPNDQNAMADGVLAKSGDDLYFVARNNAIYTMDISSPWDPSSAWTSYLNYNSSLRDKTDLANLTSSIWQSYHVWDRFHIDDNEVMGQNIWVSWSLRIYEITGSNTESDASALKNIMFNATSALWDNLALELRINWTLIDTIDSRIWTAITYEKTDINIGENNIKIHLQTINPDSIKHKIWLWLTWGTYAAPTGTNDLTWDATDGSNVGSDGSFMDITIW